MSDVFGPKALLPKNYSLLKLKTQDIKLKFLVRALLQSTALVYYYT